MTAVASLSIPQGFRQAAKHAKTELSDGQRPVCPVHLVSPSSPLHKDGARDMGDSTGSFGRNFSGSKHATRTELHRSLRENVNEKPKVVARKVEQSPETVENYLNEGVPMAWAQMVQYCRRYPGFAMDVIEAMGIEIDRDREAYSLFLSLQRQMRGS